MKNTKKATVITLIAGGLLAAGAGVSSAHGGGASACGEAAGSPGVASGNLIQAPVHVPVNVVGNTVTVVGLLNGAWGNTGVNH